VGLVPVRREAPTPAARPAQAVKTPAPGRQPLFQDGKTPSWNIEAWGETVEDAEQNALRKAQAAVKGYLSELNPPVEWTPSLDYIKTRMVKAAGAQSEPRYFEAPIEKYLRGYDLEVELTARARKDIAQYAREECAEQRMVLLGKVLAGLVAFLIAAAAYI